VTPCRVTDIFSSPESKAQVSY